MVENGMDKQFEKSTPLSFEFNENLNSSKFVANVSSFKSFETDTETDDLPIHERLIRHKAKLVAEKNPENVSGVMKEESALQIDSEQPSFENQELQFPGVPPQQNNTGSDFEFTKENIEVRFTEVSSSSTTIRKDFSKSENIKDYKRIRIEPFDLLNIQLYDGLKAVNDHGYVRFSGTIPNELEAAYLELILNEVSPRVVVVDEDGTEKVIFNGILRDFNIQAENNVKTLSGEITAGTYSMDLSPHVRTFQDANYTYEVLNSTVISGYEDANYIMAQGKDTPIQNLVAQYEETDWQFLKRLASHFNTVLVPEYTIGGSRYYFGVPFRTNPTQITSNEYTIQKMVEEYRYKIENGVTKFTERDSICYLWRSRAVYDIGDAITLNGNALYVSKIETEMRGSELSHLYYLQFANGCKVPRFYNQKATGASLNGNITGVRADIVTVTLSRDENAPFSGTRWFNYSTPYSSPSGAGWYCMPELGDTIRLYFPSADETDGYVASSTHLEIGGNRSGIEGQSEEDMDAFDNIEMDGVPRISVETSEGIYTSELGGVINSMTKTSSLDEGKVLAASAFASGSMLTQKTGLENAVGDGELNFASAGPNSGNAGDFSPASDSENSSAAEAGTGVVTATSPDPAAEENWVGNDAAPAATAQPGTGGGTQSSGGGNRRTGGGNTGGSGGGSGGAAPEKASDPLPPERTNPDTKTLTNPSGKTIALTPSRIVITNGEGTAITLSASGVTVVSANNITLNAKNELVIMSQSSSIKLSAPNSIEMTQNGSTVTLDNKFTVTGTKLHMD